MTSSRYAVLLTAVTLVLGSFNAAAAAPDEPVRCLNLKQIRSMHVIDNQRILFETRRDRYYVNTLPHKCPGLRRDATLLHRTSMDRMCDLDLVTVLDNLGWSFVPGPSCGLGRFHPLDAEEAKALRQRK